MVVQSAIGTCVTHVGRREAVKIRILLRSPLFLALERLKVKAGWWYNSSYKKQHSWTYEYIQHVSLLNFPRNYIDARPPSYVIVWFLEPGRKSLTCRYSNFFCIFSCKQAPENVPCRPKATFFVRYFLVDRTLLTAYVANDSGSRVRPLWFQDDRGWWRGLVHLLICILN